MGKRKVLNTSTTRRTSTAAVDASHEHPGFNMRMPAERQRQSRPLVQPVNAVEAGGFGCSPCDKGEMLTFICDYFRLYFPTSIGCSSRRQEKPS
ncbi:hypothetical protein E2562_016888 [Oryza meyeriana var. granulata]|uniref:Uncharacterized protein n=1 Tax=Oryza meyeriana var. granulata TaxID=110450 RepID=A0A6G1BX83_9ORYZ|nr:hypothetical protein E2562_016888 [Oryza meyeriana var. granulata]